MGVDRKAKTWELVRAPGGLLDGLQRGVALEALGESGSSFGTEVVPLQTANMGAEAGAVRVSMGADTKANDPGAAAHFRWVIFVLLRTAASAVAPLSPIPVQ